MPRTTSKVRLLTKNLPTVRESSVKAKAKKSRKRSLSSEEDSSTSTGSSRPSKIYRADQINEEITREAILTRVDDPFEKASDALLRRAKAPKLTRISTRQWRDTTRGGRPYVTGKFSAAEDKLLKAQLEKYFKMNGHSWEEGLHRLVRQQSSTNKAASAASDEQSRWIFISAALPDRHIQAIIQHVQGAIYPWPKHGEWSDEDVEMLVRCYQERPKDWKYASDVLNRYSKTCRDQYHRLLQSGQIHHVEAAIASGKSYVKKAVTPRGWSAAEDRLLLKLVKQTTGLAYPVNNIPWAYIHAKFAPYVRTADGLRRRYHHVLLLRCGAIKVDWHRMCRRLLVRFLIKVLEERPDVHWTEIKWENAIPFWPKGTPGTECKAMLLSLGGNKYLVSKELQNRFMQTGEWKKYVPIAKAVFAVDDYKEADDFTLKQRLVALKKVNGADPSQSLGDLVLPLNANPQEMHGYSRRKLRALHARELRKQNRSMQEAIKTRLVSRKVKKAGAHSSLHLDTALEAYLGLDSD